ncbi:MAG: hypothetical protein ACRDOU_23125 [Streptosporangiaceae bacterium]
MALVIVASAGDGGRLADADHALFEVVRTAAYFGNLWRPRRHDDLAPMLLEFSDESAAGEMR